MHRLWMVGGDVMETLTANIQYEFKDGKLTLEIDTTKPGEMSKSGKSMVLASTRGNVGIPGTAFKVGINLYEPRA